MTNFDNIELSNSTYVTEVQLSDDTAAFSTTIPIKTYNIQSLPDGSLFFGDPAKGHSYIWKFKNNEDFELSAIEEKFNQRSPSNNFHQSAIIIKNGTEVQHTRDDWWGLNVQFFTGNLSDDYQLSSVQKYNDNEIKFEKEPYPPLALQYSDDGIYFFAKHVAEYCDTAYTTAFRYQYVNSKLIYKYTLTTAFDISTRGNLQTFDFSTIEDCTYVKGFKLIQNGEYLFIIFKKDQVSKLVKYKLSNPYVIDNTMIKCGEFILSENGNSIASFVINNSGTKLITYNDTIGKFLQYKLDVNRKDKDQIQKYDVNQDFSLSSISSDLKWNEFSGSYLSGYEFTHWTETKEDIEPFYSDKQLVNFNKWNKTLYAQWLKTT